MGKIKRVLVRWLDAQEEANHIPREVAAELPLISRENLGFLITCDKDIVRIAFGLIENPDGSINGYDGVMAIPAGTVISLEEL